MGTLNPYQPPTAPVDTVTTVACPKCGVQTATKVSFTWWGGAVGPKVFRVVKCTGCGTKYNGRTGATLTRNIIVYQAVVVAVSAVLVYLVYSR